MKKAGLVLVIAFVFLLLLLSGCQEFAGEAFKVVSKHKCKPYTETYCEDDDTMVESKRTISCELPEPTKTDCAYACIGGECISEQEWKKLMKNKNHSGQGKGPAGGTGSGSGGSTNTATAAPNDYSTSVIHPPSSGGSYYGGSSSSTPAPVTVVTAIAPVPMTPPTPPPAPVAPALASPPPAPVEPEPTPAAPPAPSPTVIMPTIIIPTPTTTY